MLCVFLIAGIKELEICVNFTVYFVSVLTTPTFEDEDAELYSVICSRVQWDKRTIYILAGVIVAYTRACTLCKIINACDSSICIFHRLTIPPL